MLTQKKYNEWLKRKSRQRATEEYKNFYIKSRTKEEADIEAIRSIPRNCQGLPK